MLAVIGVILVSSGAVCGRALQLFERVRDVQRDSEPGRRIWPRWALPRREALQRDAMRYKVQFSADQAYVDLLEEARDLLRHQLPNRDLVEVQRRALQLLVEQLRKRKPARSLRLAAARSPARRLRAREHRQADFVMGLGGSGRPPRRGSSARRTNSSGTATCAGAMVNLLDSGPSCCGRCILPGTRPESTCYALSLDVTAKKPLGVFTGDTLFIGATRRTDLSASERTSESAGQLFDSVHRRLVPLGDQAMIWPAHGAGSVCC